VAEAGTMARPVLFAAVRIKPTDCHLTLLISSTTVSTGKLQSSSSVHLSSNRLRISRSAISRRDAHPGSKPKIDLPRRQTWFLDFHLEGPPSARGRP
jgi:hypothetical protein